MYDIKNQKLKKRKRYLKYRHSFNIKSKSIREECQKRQNISVNVEVFFFKRVKVWYGFVKHKQTACWLKTVKTQIPCECFRIFYTKKSNLINHKRTACRLKND